jgi:hypothetical protein
MCSIISTVRSANGHSLQTACHHCCRSCLLYVQSYLPVSTIPSVSYYRTIASPARAAITRRLLLTVSVRAVNRNDRGIDCISQVAKRYEYEAERVR